MSEPVLTVANQLTILRMALAPGLLVLVLSHEPAWALVVFVVAALTDLLDGLIARLGHQQTTLGALLDPIADKLLMATTYVALTWTSGLACRVPAWLTVVLLSRDTAIVVSIAAINLTLGRRVFYPTLLGKLSTVSQSLTAGVALLLNAIGECFGWAGLLYRLTLLLTVASALQYVYLATARKRGTPA